MASGGGDFFRAILRQSCELRLRPLSDLEITDFGTDAWRATGMHPRFTLEPSDGRWLCGWVLLDSRLICHSADHSARLYFDLGAGFSEERVLDVPVTHKGVIQELVWLPRGILEMWWEPAHSPSDFTQSSFRMKRVWVVGRIYRMLRRIVPVLWRRPRIKLLALELSFSRMCFDLKGAYAAAGKLNTYSPAPTYPEWIAHADTLSSADRHLIERHIPSFSISPRFVLLVVVRNEDQDVIERTLNSIHKQLYRNFEVHEQSGRRTGSGSPPMKGDTFVAIIQAGDVLPEHALYWMASVIDSSHGVGMIYSDEDCIDADGVRCDPAFKPDWSPELLRSTNYIGQFVVYRADELKRVGGLKHEYVLGNGHDLALRISEGLAAERIVHVPAILIHRGMKTAESAGAATVAACLSRQGVAATVSETLPGAYRIRYALPQNLPRVSIMIPTRDGLHLLERCVDSILQKSSYSNYEIIIVDNQSVEPKTLAYFHQVSGDNRVRVLHYDEPFNYSAINNFAARQARGEVLCLLNNDTEVISPDWLEEMVGHLLQDKVGIVGAKLYYPDGRVQHGGDLVGVGGIANHAHVYLHRTDPGYCNRAVVAQDLSAVTAACMVTWRNLYLELGGLDEEHLKVAFNDVDYCLRVREAGHRVVWTPHAELYHHESVSRGKDDTPEKRKRAEKEAKYMRRRWRKALARDPFYNPNFSQERADFSLSHAPVIERPWRRR
jgi:GT2 family glycosyltransferase